MRYGLRVAWEGYTPVLCDWAGWALIDIFVIQKPNCVTMIDNDTNSLGLK